MSDNRKKPRKELDKRIIVTDALLDSRVGQIVNISEDGFMVIGDGEINENCLYQLAMVEDGENGLEISVGAECLWLKQTDTGTQYWAGFHIIDVSPEDLQAILTLVENPQG